jgi:hypothetical protein
MDDQEPLLKELRAIREHVARIDFQMKGLIISVDCILLFLLAFVIGRFFHFWG